VARVRAGVRAALAGGAERRWLSAEAVEDVLAAAGIPNAPSRVASPEDAARAAEAIGYPVVVKGLARGLVHRSEVGAVILDLRSGEQVAEAVTLLRRRLASAGLDLERVLVQRQVEGGVEAIVGIVSDPDLGPLVVAGLGGREVELMRDVSFRMAPVTDADAAEMIDRLRMRPLLDGYRGAPRADRAALVDLVQRVSALADAVPEIRELDLNPVKVLAEGQGVIVVDARILAAAVEPGGSS
jgi:acyl-CoA synthetase (NDP forming)